MGIDVRQYAVANKDVSAPRASAVACAPTSVRAGCSSSRTDPFAGRPLVFALLGVSGAAFAHRFEPFRPYLLVLTYGLLGGAFHLAYRPARAECGPGEVCEMPRANRGGMVALWIAAVVVVLATAFPLYSVHLF